MDNTDRARWAVLISSAGQYGLFPADKPVPGGWRTAGFEGTEEACVAYVDTHWTDMRPILH
ncbi:MbtH family NRPS accessory protein [Streptomyces sp. NPDC002588]|uniref:MbtH family protein n=1 Tax=Streptomyces sp. NPDC002588 TaxID=3154419 RepID=UPI003323C7DA